MEIGDILIVKKDINCGNLDDDIPKYAKVIIWCKSIDINRTNMVYGIKTKTAARIFRDDEIEEYCWTLAEYRKFKIDSL